MYRKFRIQTKKLNKKRLAKPRTNNTKPYLDMSIIVAISYSNFTKEKNKKLNRKQKKKNKNDKLKTCNYIIFIFNQYSINKEGIILTNKLFLEIMGLGKLKQQIDKNPLRKKEKQKIKDKILNQQPISDNDIKTILEILENTFRSDIIKKVSQSHILSLTIKQLKETPIHYSFKSLHKKIITYAKKLTKNADLYDAFIEELVLDAVISYFLTIVDFKETFLENKQERKKAADDILDLALRSILVHYVPKGLLQHNLARTIAGIQYSLDSKTKTKKNAIKTILYSEDDIADSEHQALAFYGYKKNKIIVFSNERIEEVEERLSGYNIAIANIMNNIQRPYLFFSLLGKHPLDFNKGRVVVIDTKKLSYTEIPIPKIAYQVFSKKVGTPPQLLQSMFFN